MQKHTSGEYDGIDLLMPSGNMPFWRSLAILAALAVAAQHLHMRSSLSFRGEDFDIVSDFAEKEQLQPGCNTALLLRSEVSRPNGAFRDVLILCTTCIALHRRYALI